MYKLFALDIDDTCTINFSNEMSPALYKAFQEISNKIAIVFVTARSTKELTDFLDNLHLPSQYHVPENGAKILNPDRTLAYDLHIPFEEVQEIINVTQPFFIEPGFLSDEHWENGAISDGNVTGLSLTTDTIEKTVLIQKAIEELPHEYTTYTGRHWINPNYRGFLLFHKEATKGNGMRYVQEKLGISKEETIAVGDGMTDGSMFEAAGLKVAMENGEPELIEMADWVCPSVKKDGVIEVIRKYVA